MKINKSIGPTNIGSNRSVLSVLHGNTDHFTNYNTNSKFIVLN